MGNRERAATGNSGANHRPAAVGRLAAGVVGVDTARRPAVVAVLHEPGHPAGKTD